jgi:thiol-disulfide isomerase/thioredoxin
MRPFVFAIGVFSLAGICSGETSLPGCEPRPEVRKELKEKLAYPALEKLKWADRVARQYEVLDGLIARYPRELEPYRRLIEFVDWYTDDYPDLRERFQQQAKQHPDDPLALYLAGVVLFHTDTPESIRVLEAAKAKAPDFAWPNLELAQIYSSGKTVDKKKASEYLTAFFSICPASGDPTAQRMLGKAGDPAIQVRVAAALRTSLAKATDPERLEQYEALWALEFRTRPPQEHAALRLQVAEDLKRLESLNPKPDVLWVAFLKQAYKQSGAPEATVTALEDRILREFPFADNVPRMLYGRWTKTHKEPEAADTAGWAVWNHAYKEAVKGWIRDFPEVAYFAGDAWFSAIRKDNSISEVDGIAVLDGYLKYNAEYDRPMSYVYLGASDFLLDHKWQLKRAVELLRKAQSLEAEEGARQADDNLSATEQEEAEKDRIEGRQIDARRFLHAARIAGQLEEVQSLRSSIEGPPPAIKSFESDYWRNRALLAVLDNRKADGLAYYLLAFQTLTSPPQPWRGKTEDDLADEARALWKEMGGTESAWAAFSRPSVDKVQEAGEARWEKPKQQLPAFELADLSGQSWTLKRLEGKSILINIWATWCGPCNAELPQLEKLYEKMKDRTDFQILSFNVDEDLGLVEPFLKEKGYKFPVLPAYNLVRNVLNTVGIPQNWVVDPRGTWRWTQIGFGGPTDWMDDMIQRLESVKKAEGGL